MESSYKTNWIPEYIFVKNKVVGGSECPRCYFRWTWMNPDPLMIDLNLSSTSI